MCTNILTEIIPEFSSYYAPINDTPTHTWLGGETLGINFEILMNQFFYPWGMNIGT